MANHRGDTLFSVAQNAKAIFERNVDTMVAGFLIRHPDVLPGEIELVLRMGEDRSLNIVIERKGGIQFPSELGPSLVEPEDKEYDYERGVVHGWNTAIKAFHDVNPPFKGVEMREIPNKFGDVVDAVVLSDSGAIAHE